MPEFFSFWEFFSFFPLYSFLEEGKI